MKVLHLLSTSEFSGAENVALQIIIMFNNEIEMAYCSLDGNVRNKCYEYNINYYPLHKLTFSSLKKVIQTFKPDVIHAHDLRASFLASMFSSKKLQVISHIHTSINKKSLKTFLYNMVVHKFKKIIFVSDYSFDFFPLKKKIQDKCIVLYNVIDAEQLKQYVSSDLKKYAYDGIFLGRLAYPKNPLFMMNVLKEVIREIPSFTFAIVGNGDYLKECSYFVIQHKLDRNIIFYGYLNNPYKILSESKFLLMTSVFEGTPMVVLESQSLGVPVISTPVGGIPYIIKDGYNGFLCETLEEFVNAIVKLVTSTSIQKSMRINSLSKSNTCNSINDYYSKLIRIYNANN